MPFLDAANARIEHTFKYKKTDFYSTEKAKQWNSLLKNNKIQIISHLSSSCFPSFLSLFKRSMSSISGPSFILESFLTQVGRRKINELRASVYNTKKLPLAMNGIKTHWYYERLNCPDKANDICLDGWKTLNIDLRRLEAECGFHQRTLAVNGNKILRILRVLSDQENNYYRSSIHGNPEVLRPALINIENKAVSPYFFFVFSLLQAKRFVEEDGSWTKETKKFPFTQEDLFDFFNVLIQIHYIANPFENQAIFMSEMLKIAERKTLITSASINPNSLSQRSKMWKFLIDQTYEIQVLNCYFIQTVSLPYRGMNGWNSNVYHPQKCTVSRQDVSSVQQKHKEWEGLYMCDAEVRFLIAVRLVGFLLDVTQEDVLLDTPVEFSTEESKK